MTELTNILPYLKNFALKLTKNIHDAEDLVHDTVIKVLSNKDKFIEGTSLKSWTGKIMRNEFIDKCRKKSLVFIEKDNVYQYSSCDYILEAINTLDNKYRTPFTMRYQGYKYDEIAEHLNIPVGTVKARIFKARSELKTKIAV